MCWICFNWCSLMCMDVTLALQRTTQDCCKQNQIAVRVGLELGSPTFHPLGHAASYKHLTWHQAQFERFSYILPNGFAMPAGMLFTKRNKNRAWSQVNKHPSSKPNQKPSPKPSIHVQWNPFNTNTNGTCHSIHINQVSVLSRFIVEKNIWACFRQDKRNCSLYMGVHKAEFHCTNLDRLISTLNFRDLQQDRKSVV